MSKNNKEWPLRHLSIRVPWHDNQWKGTVCQQPDLNSSCLKLSRIAEHRSDPDKNQCEPIASQSIETLEQAQWPCCVAESALFMAPFDYTRTVTHPYTQSNSEHHSHLLPTPIRHPQYSAPAIPFKWMRYEYLDAIKQQYGEIDVDIDREPSLPFKSGWWQEYRNQRALLDCAFGHIKPKHSLCFFYAKEVPFIEDAGRVIVGVGRVLHVSDPVEYRCQQPGSLRSMLWEHLVQHSIRSPGFKDGFLLPYHDLIPHLETHPELDPAIFTAFAPDTAFDEFSYAAELVSHDAAIAALLACAGALTRLQKVIGGDWSTQLRWLNDRIAELWKMRGPCPGLGAALCAFGIEYGVFVAREIETKLDDNQDPWPLVAKIFENPASILSRSSAAYFSRDLCSKWRLLPDERRALLKLLSRFNLTPDQAKPIYVQEERQKARFSCQDADLIANPYLIYELTRLGANPINLNIVDRGVFPEPVIRDQHPLPEPSAIDGGVDSRRVRAFLIAELERAASAGHTLQRKVDLVRAVRDLDIQPTCPIDQDQLVVVEPHLTDVIERPQLADHTECYQLIRLAKVGSVIRNSIEKRRKGKCHTLNENWRQRLDVALKPIDPADREQEERRRIEKAAALKVLAESRIALLVGPAGTGKTTLLSVLCGHPAITSGEVLFLAPTGKARVRMEQAAKDKGLPIQGYTIAQFLNDCDRYDGETGRYRLSTFPKKTPAKTVIIDECSMLTEEMLAATLDALQGVERLILVGDPRQLPPIGAGRPFVDLVTQFAPAGIHGRFPRIAKDYAELTVTSRQRGSEDRDDVALSRWFSGTPLAPGEDEVLDRVLLHDGSPHIHFKAWNTPDELRQRLLETVVEELKLTGPQDVGGFEKSLGGTESGNYRYFNVGAAEFAEQWQILTPMRKKAHGVQAINRQIHQAFRAQTLDSARRERYRKIPKPMGPEQIVYGDKVINIRNHHRDGVYPSEGAQAYLANGEIGIAVGQFKTKKMNKAPWLLKVEFSSQLGYQYDFSNRDFGEEGNPFLELAYALTVHKAQGSEFGTVILILPNPCLLLSRELLYTALTRQRNRLVILHQGRRSDLRGFSSGEYSEVARRLTNLLVTPSPVEHQQGVFYEQNLIHRTLRGEMVRSKSELIIADRLQAHGIEYVYEQSLTLGGQTRYPDFTIDDAESGQKYYWEHCGLLGDPEYVKRWERKQAWYRNNGILPLAEGSGPNGTLIVTQDNENGGISSQEIQELIKRIFS